jgi:cell division protein FtsW
MAASTVDQQVRIAGYALIGIAFLLFSFGCIFIFNVSSAEALDASRPNVLHASLIKQLIFAATGAILAFFTWRFSLSAILNHIEVIFLFICIALLLCFIPGIGLTANGSHRWIGFAGYYIQPSEFAKFIIPLFALKKFQHLNREPSDITWLKVAYPFALIAFSLGIIIVEPDNRSTIITTTGVIIACFITRLPIRFWLMPLMISGIIIVGIASKLPYVQRRVEVFLNPQLDTSGKGYQPYQAKIAAGSGGWSGRGLGQGLQKFSYLPEAQNDYIVAIIAEELGFIGIASLIMFYSIFILLGFWIALSADLILQEAVGVILYMIGIQVFLNLAVVGGLLPSTGLNLPFVSQGGSSLWACSLALACLISAATVNNSNLEV